jgi:hypothetical protein
MEILRAASAARHGPARGTLDPDWVRDGGPIRLAPEGSQQFRTPSRKLEFYSEALAAQGLPALPDWQSDPEEARQAARWPLRLLTAQGHFQSHTAYSGLVLRISDEVRPGVVLVPGQRPDSETVAGTINILISDRYTDIGEVATYQSTWLDVTAWPLSVHPKPCAAARLGLSP